MKIMHGISSAFDIIERNISLYIFIIVVVMMMTIYGM
jgi:hypothetical protein